MTAPTWDEAQHLLREFDGMATEIFLTGLPISHLPVVVSALSKLPVLEVTYFDDDGPAHGEPFDAAWRSRFEAAPVTSCYRSLLSAGGTARHLQVYLWIDTTVNLLELELVFWNDMNFPPGLEIDEYERRLESLCSLVEECRIGVPYSQCVLTPEHNGPIEELSKNDDVIWW